MGQHDGAYLSEKPIFSKLSLTLHPLIVKIHRKNQKTMITTIIFDLDGTLLNTLDDLASSVNYALCQSHYPQRTTAEVRQFLGNGIRYLIEHAVPKGTPQDDFEKCFACFKAYYMDHCLDETRPYDGIPKLLHQLHDRGYKLAIVSNKLQPAVTELQERFFNAYITVAIGESPEVRRKPAPDSVYRALDLLHSSRDEAIYIGDSEVDMATAHNAGLPCISVLWGFRDRDFLIAKGAFHIASQPSDILSLLSDAEA